MNWQRLEGGILIASSVVFVVCVLAAKYVGEALPQAVRTVGLICGAVMVVLAARITFFERGR